MRVTVKVKLSALSASSPEPTVRLGWLPWGACQLTVTLSEPEVTPPREAVASLVTFPASTSAWVVVYEPVHVRNAPGASPPPGTAGHVMSPDAILSSSTSRVPDSVTVPVLVTS